MNMPIDRTTAEPIRAKARARPIPCATVVCLLAATLALFGCKPKERAVEIRPTEGQTEGKVVVFAAASLRDAFTALGDEFRRHHSGATVEYNFAGTQELRTQVEQGAEADVFASADQRHMGELAKASLVARPRIFAKNEPVIAVSRDAATRVTSFAELPNATRLIVGVPEVPIGRYTIEILDRASKSLGPDFRARVEAKVVSKELNVRQICSKIALGEADAGVVYRTDVKASNPDVRIVTIPPEFNVIAEYPVAVVAKAKHPVLAAAWVELIFSESGQNALRKAGFGPP